MFAESGPAGIHARAPGKINVFIKVGDVLDNGYHNIATAFQAVSLYEDVYAQNAEDYSVTVTGSVDTSSVPLDEKNLAIRAAQLLALTKNHPGGVLLHIDKNVPVAGGMGGGSADAAATLIACDALWGTHCSKDELLEMAAELGADVPFALTGGTAVGVGVGDELSPALAQGEFHWVLAIAEFGMSTPDVYKELDKHRDKHRAELFPSQSQPTVDASVMQAIRTGNARLLAESLYNDLQAASLHLAPGLTDILELGEKNGALAGIVSGSGPTIAFLAEDPDSALHLQIVLSAARLTVVRASGPVNGARLVRS